MAKAQHVGVFSGTKGKAVCQVNALAFIFFKKSGREIQDQPVVRRSIVDDRTMYLSGSHQHEVARLELVRFALDVVADTAAFEIQQFMKIVVVALKIPVFRVGEVKDAEVAVQITGLFAGICHVSYPPAIQYKALFARFKAEYAFLFSKMFNKLEYREESLMHFDMR